jgi:hypothetical protein
MNKTLITLLALGGVAQASESHPQKPFAGFVDVPDKGTLVVSPWFTYSAFQAYWQGTDRVDIARGDNEYDYEYYSGILMLEYGLWQRWAFDVTVAYVDAATRCFNADADVEKTSGLADIQFGMRYAVSRESANSPWTPDFTLRVGGIVPGTYDENFPFAPGYGEVGIEPAIFARKTIWGRESEFAGGLFASAGYRHMVSYAPDSLLLSIGLFQHLGRFTVSAGYRQQQAMSGDAVTPNTATADPYDVNYDNRVKEMNYMAEWGGNYRLKNGITLNFYMNSNFDGRNTGEKLTYSGFVSIPFKLTHD